MKLRIRALLLAAMFVVSLLPTMSFAAATEVTTYTDLKSAMEATSGEIKLGDDITMGNNSAACLKVTGNITLDLNGHSLTQTIVDPGLSVAAIAVRQGATLTVIDSVGGGKISATKTAIQLTGTLNLQSGVIACDATPTSADVDASFAYPVWVYIPASSGATPEFNMVGGSLELGATQESFTYPNPVCVDDAFGTRDYLEDITIEISAGTVEGLLDVGAVPEGTNVTISGGTFASESAEFVNANLAEGLQMGSDGTVGAVPAYAGPVMNWVKVNTADNGVVKSGPLAASAGATVTLYPKAAAGYVLDTVEVLDAEGNAVELDGLKFAIPAGGVTVNATFKLAE